MEIVKTDQIKLKCDINGCAHVAEYKIQAKKSIFSGDWYICGDCLKELHNELLKLFTPPSLTNILKKKPENKKEKTE